MQKIKDFVMNNKIAVAVATLVVIGVVVWRIRTKKK